MKPINIFIDCHVFDGGFQGTTSYIRGMYQELVQHSYINFYFASHDMAVLKDVFGTAENIHYLQYSSHNKFWRLLVDIPKLIKDNKIDYAHFQYIVPPIKYCKYINTVHDVLFLDYPQYFPLSYKIKNKFLFKWSARHSDIVLTVSEYSKNQIKKHFGINQVFVTPNAVDTIFFKKYDKSKIEAEVLSKFKVQNYWLFISRWEPRKNHHTLLKVFVDGEFYKNHDLVFVGDKAILNQQYNQLYNSLSEDIKKKIHSFSKITFSDLLLFLRGARLSVYPSVAEGFGIPPLEAVAAGIPSVCSGTTSMADFSFLKKYSFNPLDASDVDNIIRETLRDFEPIPKETILEMYNWKIGAEALYKLLK